jgi:hypothetical protein
VTLAEIWAMFTPDAPDLTRIDLYARFVLSGYIILTIRNIYIATDRASLGEIAVDVFLLSLINQMVWLIVVQVVSLLQSFVIAASTDPTHFTGNPFGPNALLFFETLALPIGLGILFGYSLRIGAGKRIARRLAMPIIGPTPRAYDHVFSQRSPCFVILSFEGERTIYGYFGLASLAGRDTGRSEIFLERLYAVEDDGDWVETIPPRSALVNLSGLRAIEFIEEVHHAAQTTD